VKNPIDAFVLSRLEQSTLAPVPSASRLTLLRRVYFDLIGLPPSAEEIENFADDMRPNAYAAVIERLLVSRAWAASVPGSPGSPVHPRGPGEAAQKAILKKFPPLNSV